MASSPEDAVLRVEAIANRASGAVAYSWQGDMRTGELGRLRVLKRVGVLPCRFLEQIYSAATPY